MPERVTGLDIGRNSVKAVSVSASLKGYQVIDAVLVEIAGAGGLEQALERVFERDAFQNSPCVTALPLEACSFRDVRLPFKDKKRITQTLPYELEQTLPFPIDEALVDYLVVNRSDETELLAVAVREQTLAERLSLLPSTVSSFPVVDVETAALAGWITEESKDGEAPAILLDLGAARTSLVVVAEGRIVHLRSLPLGGTKVTGALADELGVAFEEAEQIMRSGGSQADRVLAIFCGDLHREVSTTLDLLCLRRVISGMPERLYLAGGCALSERFRNELGRLFSCTPRDLEAPREQTFQFSEEAKQQWNPTLMNHALALALREAGKGRGFNFVQGRNRTAGILEKIREELPWIGPLAAAVILLAGINLYLDYRNDSRYLAALRAESTRIFTETLPEVTRIVDPVQQMRTALDRAQRPASGREGGASVTVLSILRDLSGAVPDSLEFLITNFTYDEQTIRIQAETDNFNTVDAIRSALERGDAFQSVTITSANLMRQGGRVSFDLRMEPRR